MTSGQAAPSTRPGPVRRRIETGLRLLRTDRVALLRAFVGRTETMVVFASNVDDVPLPVPTNGLEFRPLTADDLRRLPMPADFRSEQLSRMEHLGVSHAYGVFCDGRLAHVSWLYDRDLEGRSPPRYLDLRRDEAEISACVTLPEFRGRGTYGLAIRGIFALARTRGVRRIYMKTSPSNHASQRGIEKAGLRRCGTVVRIVPPLRPSSRGFFLRRFARGS